MENENQLNENFWPEAEKNHKRGKILGGILLVVIGSLFLGRELGMEIPGWIFSWKVLLIAIGFIIMVKSNFKRLKGFLLMVIGSLFLISDLMPELGMRSLMWPIAVIIVGLYIIFKPKKKYQFMKHRMYRRQFAHNYECRTPGQSVEDDIIESTTFMGGVKKNILSKNFKGGEITNVLGGSEINLSQADFTGTITLEITNVLGGTKLVVPGNWEIQSELVSVMGSIEDKRFIQPNVNVEGSKVLVLRGTVFMGGIDIKSY